jgi:hypothetical protein
LRPFLLCCFAILVQSATPPGKPVCFGRLVLLLLLVLLVEVVALPLLLLLVLLKHLVC